MSDSIEQQMRGSAHDTSARRMNDPSCWPASETTISCSGCRRRDPDPDWNAYRYRSSAGCLEPVPLNWKRRATSSGQAMSKAQRFIVSQYY